VEEIKVIIPKDIIDTLSRGTIESKLFDKDKIIPIGPTFYAEDEFGWIEMDKEQWQLQLKKNR